MDVRVEEQCLGPRVKHGNGAGNGTESALGYGVESFDCRLEEQGVASSSIHQEERVKGSRHSEDEVEVQYGEELLLLRFDPASLIETLALRTMPVSAGVVERLLPPTLVAHLEVASQKRRSTSDDVSDHSTTITPEMFGRRRVSSEDLGQGWRAARQGRHWLSGVALSQGIQWTTRLLEVVARHVNVALCRAQAAMA